MGTEPMTSVVLPEYRVRQVVPVSPVDIPEGDLSIQSRHCQLLSVGSEGQGGHCNDRELRQQNGRWVTA